MNKTIISVVTFVIIALGAAYYAATYRFPAAQESPAPTPILDAPDWQTYTDIQYGFELQHPTTWKIVANPNYYGGGVLGEDETPYAITYGTEGETIADIKAVIFRVGKRDGKVFMEKSDYCLQICDLPANDSLHMQADQILSTFKFIAWPPSLQAQVFAAVEQKTDGSWDKELTIWQVDASQNTAAGSWIAKDYWDWIAWKDEKESWHILVSLDGFDCKEVDSIPAYYKEFLKDVIQTSWGERYCYAHSAIKELIDITTWNAYRNPQYGFQVALPASYSTREALPSQLYGRPSGIYLYPLEYGGNETRYRSTVKPLFDFTGDPDGNSYLVSIRIFRTDQYRFAAIPVGIEYGYDPSNGTWWENDGNGRLKTIPETVRKNGWVGYEFVTGDAGANKIVIAIPHGEFIFEVEFFWSGDNFRAFPSIDQILSTFTFTK